VSGHPSEGGGAFGFFHAEGLTDEGARGDGETKTGHESEGFDAESGADGGGGGGTFGHPFEDGEEHEKGSDTHDGHESGGGGDAEDAFGPIPAGEFDAPGFAEGGSGDEDEIDDRRDPCRDD